MIPGSSGFGWQSGAIDDAAQEAIRNYGSDAVNNIKIGLLEKSFGASTEHVRNRILTLQQKQLNSSPMAARYIAAGGNPFASGSVADYGDTSGMGLAARTVALEKKNAEAERKRLRADKKEDAQTALTQTLAVGQQGIDAAAAEGERNRQANIDMYTHTSKENNAVRSHEASERAKDRSLDRQLGNMSNDMQMQMAFIEKDIANKRMEYDRETRRMDKRDAAIAQLMQGIGQLGGAFSL